MREQLCNAMFFGNTYGSDLTLLERYFSTCLHGKPRFGEVLTVNQSTLRLSARGLRFSMANRVGR